MSTTNTTEELQNRIKQLEEENKYLLARLEHSEYERFKSYLTSSAH